MRPKKLVYGFLRNCENTEPAGEAWKKEERSKDKKRERREAGDFPSPCANKKKPKKVDYRNVMCSPLKSIFLVIE